MSIRAFLNYEPDEKTPDHSSFTVIRQRLGLDLYELAIGAQVQAQGRRGNDLNGQGAQGETGRHRDAFQALAHHCQGVLGGKEQDWTPPANGEWAKVWCTRSKGEA